MSKDTKDVSDSDYLSIIPTAYLTAYPLIYTDIPYSKEVFRLLEHIRNDKNEPTLSQEQKIPRLAPELEARHKLINKLLKETHINQVLELAAGLSTRGLIMTQNSDIKYSELDLSPMAQLKKEIVGKIKKIPQNLNIVAGNALRLADLKKATSSFDSNKPLAIINEGLLRYLSFPEKAQVARNVHVLLKKFGGVWLTCDVAPKNFLATQDSVTKPGLNKELKNMSGKNFENNMFENQEHFTNFFADLGFSVEVHALSEIEGELTSPGQLEISKTDIKNLFGSAVVVTMKAI